jgi:hypothetical protein
MPRLAVDEYGFPKKYRKILKLYIEGNSAKDIASTLKMDYTHTTKILRMPAFQAATVKVHEGAVNAARSIFEQNAVDAARKIVKIANSGKPDNRVQLDASKEILYQCGMKPVEVIETRGREYTPEEVQSSLTVIKEIEQIEEKLATQGSGFLLKQQPDEPSIPAPVKTDVVEEVKTDA